MVWGTLSVWGAIFAWYGVHLVCERQSLHGMGHFSMWGAIFNLAWGSFYLACITWTFHIFSYRRKLLFLKHPWVSFGQTFLWPKSTMITKWVFNTSRAWKRSSIWLSSRPFYTLDRMILSVMQLGLQCDWIMQTMGSDDGYLVQKDDGLTAVRMDRMGWETPDLNMMDCWPALWNLLYSSTLRPCRAAVVLLLFLFFRRGGEEGLTGVHFRVNEEERWSVLHGSLL